MTQQPFSRPGAIDLSALKRPAPSPSAPTGGPRAPAGGGAAGATSYALDVTEQNFQEVIERSMTAPVLLVLFSRSRMPESGQLADDLATLSGEFEGRFLAGLVDVDVSPGIAQAMQVQSLPLLVAVLDGRPAPLLQDVVPLEELRTALTQVMQQLAAQGMTARHQPLSGAAPAAAEDEDAVDPRYAAAQDALANDDIDGAVAEYQKLVDANPADVEAAAGLAMAKVLQRAQGVDAGAARAAADAAPDDLAAQTLAADLDLLAGDVEAAFGRLVELVRRSAGDERNQAREHLLGLFAAVGNDDPRVLKGRQSLASALF
ncbi:co-chaperone YbbN [Nocardioides sp. cx-173]|uniref:co-chaperone YbbN n=1 Tax=Nocardioides sp. cx-173 TaxID=2898796 RepID=UPI001E557F60|nr:tetratricopeptide repeat protein [Nocardioides sp. cx-173]MCD4526241.1 tetratricopeptide repeat protein [Nocardioides sp. cx-173]UGB40549.1 tetratricopeptide repeat protein [Nocardioides sp. cx-173]